jgi:acetyltransferase
MKTKEKFSKYTIQSRSDLKKILIKEKKKYMEYIYPSVKKYLSGAFKSESIIKIMHWQQISRITDYHDYMFHVTGSKWHLIKYLWYIRKRNRLGNKIGFEISTELIGKGLIIYHYNNVINPGAVIGENLHLHGCNVIGNAGNGDLRCPIIGNNVMMGAGAKVIGNVTIADGIKIGAGAVVVSSFLEKGITIGGVPARKLK